MQYEIRGKVVYASTGGVDHIRGQPGIVFLHGAGMDHTVWVLFNRFFARNGFNTLAPDLPGHGRSHGKPLATVEEMAEWLGELLSQADIGKAALVGHSLGSLVAIETAARQADLCSHLVLLGSACPMPVGEALLGAARQNQRAAIDMIMLYGHAYSSQLGGNPVAGINIVNSSMRLLERALDGRLFTDLNACHTYSRGLDAATGIQQPTTLILGDQDRMTPPAATKPLIDALANAQVVSVPRCGHMMLSEQPERVHQALVAALGQARAR